MNIEIMTSVLQVAMLLVYGTLSVLCVLAFLNLFSDDVNPS